MLAQMPSFWRTVQREVAGQETEMEEVRLVVAPEVRRPEVKDWEVLEELAQRVGNSTQKGRLEVEKREEVREVVAKDVVLEVVAPKVVIEEVRLVVPTEEVLDVVAPEVKKELVREVVAREEVLLVVAKEDVLLEVEVGTHLQH